MADQGRLQGLNMAPEYDAPIVPQRSLKMRRSLSRLFSPPSRRFSKSRPSSPGEDAVMVPPTPQVPFDIWPLSPKTPKSPVLSSPASSKNMPWRSVSHPTKPVSSQRGPNGESKNPEDFTVPKRSHTDVVKGVASSRPGFRNIDTGRKVSDGLGQAYTTADGASFILHSPISDNKKAKTGLRIPSTFESLAQKEEERNSLSRVKSQPSLRDSSRPSVVGQDIREKPTGKRRRDITNQDESSTATNTPTEEAFPPHLQRRWQSTSTDKDRRTSLRSAITASSSPVDSASTKRSSVLTKGTSVTELTSDPYSRPVSKAEGLTVEDTIDMYARGFTDDAASRLPSRRNSLGLEGDQEEHRRSFRIAEAMSESMGSSLPSQRPSTSDSLPSSAILSGQTFRNDLNGPPPVMPPTTSRDQYGFVKANHHVTPAQYDAWYSQYLPHQERRMKKWLLYMREHNLPTYQPTKFPPRSPKTQRYILKGIPPAWRGAAWFHYSGGEDYHNRHPDLFASLVSRSENSLPEVEKEAIERDLHRTFPDNLHFKPAQDASELSSHEPPIISSLRRVLGAFALHAPKIGYCQSLNFIAGMLLLFLTEEKAFAMLHVITSDFLPGTHSLNLEGANVDLWVLMMSLKSTLPNIYSKVGLPSDGSQTANDVAKSSKRSTPQSPLTASISASDLPPISLCTTSWFLSLFISVLPTETTLRVWDALFYDGSRVLFRSALGIFRLGEKRILTACSGQNIGGNSGSASLARNPSMLARRANNGSNNGAIAGAGFGGDSMELFQTVQQLPRSILDASALMKIVARKEGVTNTWVREQRAKVRAQRERGRAADEAERTNKQGDAPASSQHRQDSSLRPHKHIRTQSRPSEDTHVPRWKNGGDVHTVAPDGRVVGGLHGNGDGTASAALSGSGPSRARANTTESVQIQGPLPTINQPGVGNAFGAPSSAAMSTNATGSGNTIATARRRASTLWRRESHQPPSSHVQQAQQDGGGSQSSNQLPQRQFAQSAGMRLRGLVG